MKHGFVKNHENLVVFWSISYVTYVAGTCGWPCVTHFATMSIFRRIQLFLGAIIFSATGPCHIASPLSTSVLCAIANDQQARLHVHSIKPSDSVQSLAYSTAPLSVFMGSHPPWGSDDLLYWNWVFSAAFRNSFPVSAIFKNSFPFFTDIFNFSGFPWLRNVILPVSGTLLFSFLQRNKSLFKYLAPL